MKEVDLLVLILKIAYGSLNEKNPNGLNRTDITMIWENSIREMTVLILGCLDQKTTLFR
jgi:hypothetical protein